MHAIEVLREDHARIEKLLNELTAAGGATRIELAEHLERDLIVHLAAEDNVFLPQVREAVEDSKRTTEEFFEVDPDVLTEASRLVAQSYENNAWVRDLLQRLEPVPGQQEIEDLRNAVGLHVELEEDLFQKAQGVLEGEDFERIGDLIEHCKWQVRGLAQARLASSSSFKPPLVAVKSPE